MHILISCVGSAGDVHPFIAIGRALQQRGHEVDVLASPHFGARIAAAGLGFFAFGSQIDFDRVVADPEIWHPRRGFAALWRAMAPQLLDAHDAVVERVRPGQTVLVGSTLAWHVRLAQETQRLAAATVHLSPSCIVSSLAPAVWPGPVDLGRWPRWAVRLVQAAIERFAVDRAVQPEFDRIRLALGLPPARRVLSRWMNSPQLVVCAWPEWFAPRQDDWPRQAVTTGFPRGPVEPPAAAEDAAVTGFTPGLAAFLAEGRRPIAFTPGSAMAHGRHFFDTALAACVQLGERALFISPYADQLPAPLPEFSHAVGFVPFDRLLPRVAALVHHGGIGTCAAALAAGLPQLVTPFAHDQFDNAARLQRLGVGQPLPSTSPPGRWASALRRLLGDPGTAAACTGAALRMGAPDEAAGRIASWIEALDPQQPLAAPVPPLG